MIEEEMLERHQCMVYKIANKYRKRANAVHGFEDIVSAGTMGLLHSVRNFDPSFGYTFSTYAYPNIHGYIRRMLRDGRDPVKYGRGIKDRAYAFFVKTGGKHELKDITPELIQKELDTTYEWAFEIFEYMHMYNPTPIDKEINGDGGKVMSFHELLPDKRSEDAFNSILLEDLISKLPSEQQQLIIKFHLEGMTQTEIGNKCGVSQVQVSRLLTKALRQLVELGADVPETKDDNIKNNKGLSTMTEKTVEKIAAKESKKRAPGAQRVGDHDEAIRLLQTTDKRVAEIVELTGVPNSTGYLYQRKYRAKRKTKRMAGNYKPTAEQEIAATIAPEIDEPETVSLNVPEDVPENTADSSAGPHVEYSKFSIVAEGTPSEVRAKFEQIMHGLELLGLEKVKIRIIV